MKRHLRSITLSLALLVALCLTLTRRPHGGMHLVAGGAHAAVVDDKHPYDLASLRVFTNTLMKINDSYVDPTRVDPKQMLLSALDQVQKSVAEVLVEPHPDQNRVVVGVDTAKQEFAIGDVDSPWALSMRMREIFRYIAQNLPPGTDAEATRNIEYAATNGMLSTLDPHSILLEPQQYTEMKLSTRGSFGGLGIVIGIRKGALTVIRPVKDTPAWRAGIKAGDRIVRIEKESTVNMMLNDAVSRLRGDPDSKVELWVEKGSEKNAVAKKTVLTRAVIQVNTVEAHLLKNNVGYIKLYNSFAANTVDEMRRELEDLKAKGIKSLVIDLRSNPGGLLDQAIKVADEFVDSGTIVTTVGYANKQREEKRATPGNQPHMPIAVLVNHGSASASEIVAGALKNLDRAVLVGTRTFGKGSVQVLYDYDDGSALKLTIAQYLTPGDVSIQSVGVVPDVFLDKVAVSQDNVRLFNDYKGIREADLDAHLTSKNVQEGGKPAETLRFLAEKPSKKVAKALLRDDENKDDDDPEAEPEDDLSNEDTFIEDYEIQFARDLVAQAKGWKRHEVIASSKPFFDKKQAEEEAKISDALRKLGVDWQKSGNAAAPLLAATLTTDKAKNEASAGDTLHIKATVTNRGQTAAGQVRAQLKGDDSLLDGREFVFGHLKPGESRSWTLPVKIPIDQLTRVDPLHLEIGEEHGNKTQAAEPITLHLSGMARPQFAYSYQLIDDIKGNGDGLAQRGESLRLHVNVKNIGSGKSMETLAQLRNLSDEGVFINKGRFNVDNLAPGESKSVDFTFDVTDEYRPDAFKVELSVYDAKLHEYVTDKLSFPIAPSQPVAAAAGMVKVSASTVEIRGGAAKDAPIIGVASKDALLPLSGVCGNFFRVDVELKRPGFVLQTAVQRSSGTGAVAKMVPTWQVSPPRLDVKTATALTDGATMHLSGGAKDDRRISDVYVFVSNRAAKIDRRKVFYRSNRKSASPTAMNIDTDIPLWPGANVISVVARQSNQVQSQETLIVERSGPQLAATATEKTTTH